MGNKLNVATVVLVVLCSVVGRVAGQEMECYGSGSIAGAVIGTFVLTLLLLGLIYLAYTKLCVRRGEKHLVLETDPEKGDAFAFDNPGFKDASLTPAGKAVDKGTTKIDSGKHKWHQWSPLGALVSTKNEKKRTLDDSCIENGELKVVSLRSHDFTGLGFNIYGNMRDGIFIKDVLHRGPAHESGKLNPGDRINSLRISFEHMVYEDALTILSYASPYEVEIEASSGIKSQGPTSGQGARPMHPIYRSSSSSDLFKIGKSARSRLFQDNMDNTTNTEYSTLQLSSNNASLERSDRKSPKPDINSLTKPERNKKLPVINSKGLTPEQLKTQLEHNLAQKISNPNEVHVNDKKITIKDTKKAESEIQTSETETKKGFQKFGIRVLPMESKQDNLQPSRSPKSAELSQNDNNINLEKNLESDSKVESIDEVDKMKLSEEAPPVKRREKPNKNIEVPKDISSQEQPLKVSENFERQNSLNGSGIKRDKAGIPQEIPDHMMNAAVAARKNRKSTEMIDKITTDPEDSETIKSPKKQKGKAPAPPPELPKTDTEKPTSATVSLNFTNNFDEISAIEEKDIKPEKIISISEDINKNVNKTDDSIAELKTEIGKSSDDSKGYCSDSDMETDNQSSVNTIELNSSDITIHHSEEDSDMKGRKTASTGDLSKIHKTRKTSTGTLERAQSLDITDSGIPTLTKKRKASKEETDAKLSSDENLYEKSVLKNKEPRLSLALDGLDTFQRNRLKKSSEWGNLEDAIITLDKMEVKSPTDVKIEFTESKSPIKFDFGTKNTEFGSSITKINDDSVASSDTDYSLNFSYKEDTSLTNDLNKSADDVKIVNVKNQIWPLLNNKDDSDVILDPSNSNNLLEETPPFEIKDDDPVKVSSQNDVETLDTKLTEPSTVNIQTKVQLNNQIWPDLIVRTDENVNEENQNSNVEMPDRNLESVINQNNDDIMSSDLVTVTSTKVNASEPFSLKAQFQEKLKTNQETEPTVNNTSSTNINYKPQSESSVFHPGKSSQNFIFAEKYASNNDADNIYNFSSKLYDTNVSDDIKVSRHSLGSLERPKSDVLKSVNKLKMQSLISSDQGGVSNITITENKQEYGNGIEHSSQTFDKQEKTDEEPENTYDMSTASELYTTAIESSMHDEPNSITDIPFHNINDIKNITITETAYDSNLITDSPSSLTIDTSSDGPDSIKSHTLTYVTEIQVSTPSNGTPRNVSEIEILATSKQNSIPEIKKPEEVLKRLPEMKFTTSSYESPKTPEKRISQIELLRSNFEKSPPKPSKPAEISPSKSRIPIATSKIDLKTSPERREMRFGDHDVTDEKEIVEIMSSAIHSTPLLQNQRLQNKNPSRNVTVTSIRTSSKIPSGSHIATYASKPPVPARPVEHIEAHDIRTSNGGSESFKQWVFNPGESSITSIIVDNKESHK